MNLLKSFLMISMEKSFIENIDLEKERIAKILYKIIDSKYFSLDFFNKIIQEIYENLQNLSPKNKKQLIDSLNKNSFSEKQFSLFFKEDRLFPTSFSQNQKKFFFDQILKLEILIPDENLQKIKNKVKDLFDKIKEQDYKEKISSFFIKHIELLINENKKTKELCKENSKEISSELREYFKKNPAEEKKLLVQYNSLDDFLKVILEGNIFQSFKKGKDGKIIFSIEKYDYFFKLLTEEIKKNKCSNFSYFQEDIFIKLMKEDINNFFNFAEVSPKQKEEISLKIIEDFLLSFYSYGLKEKIF